MGSEFKQVEEKMSKTISVFKEDLTSIRAGRANPSVLDKVMVEYYGTMTPLNQVGNISIPEARMILIQPWETSLLKEIEKSILKSDLGLNPTNDGKAIRLVFPPLTEERRRDLKKEVERRGEEAKVAVRAIRRDAVDDVKEQKKNSEITEDDLRDAEKQIQNITDKFIGEIDKIVAAKSEEIMEV